MMIKARKRFGQNFLQCPNTIGEMLACIDHSGLKNTLEIGPGLGALTIPLLLSKYNVHCIEIDFDIVSFLTEKLDKFDESQLTIEQGDVLKKPLMETIETRGLNFIFSNLPYNISTPFFLKLVFEKVHVPGFFLVQKEVAERLCAPCGSSNYSRLSVITSTTFNFERLFDVPPSAFSPAPKVQSTFMKMTVKDDVFPVDKKFEVLVRDAFSQRRKKISNTLKEYALDFDALGLDEQLRPQELSLQDYIKIYNALD